LPADAKLPEINDDLNRTFVQTINITADSREALYSLRDTLKNVARPIADNPRSGRRDD
jgi:hypothetical protein